MCLLPSLKWSSTVSSLGIVQWDFTRRDHPGNPRRVSGSGPVRSYIFLFRMLYLFIYFSCTVLCTFHILSYTILFPFHILSCTMYFSYTVIFHILSSCTLLLVIVTVYYHRIAVLCFSYHVIYSIHFICIYFSFSFRFHVCKYLRSGYGK